MARRSTCFAFLCAIAAACGGGGGGGDADAAAADCAGGAPGSATLIWSASAGPRVASYRVYHGVASRSYGQPRGAGLAVGRVQCHVATGLDSGTLYYFAVTAVDADGNESDYSNEASKRIE